MPELPAKFIEKMKLLLGEEEFNLFCESYGQEAAQGIRVNPLKISRDSLVSRVPFSLRPVPWCRLGFYYSPDDRPGKHPYHAAGLYYIQEPSAMAVVEILQPQPGERILDLCAAPGGKSTHIYSYLGHTGLLVANEINANRVKALAENLERWGARNILVTNETPEKLAERMPAYFDKILVDAPCSGEGMFRKLPEACLDWSEGKSQRCAAMQKNLLAQAASMLKPGGVLVYSTCTFSPEENEEQVNSFLQAHNDFEICPVENDWLAPGTLAGTVRIWPHKVQGEGHFVARLRKKGDAGAGRILRAEQKLWSGRKSGVDKINDVSPEVQKLFATFCRETLNIVPEGPYLMFGDQLYAVSDRLPELSRLKISRAGWHLGTVKKGRFEPSHALALGLHAGQWKRTVNLRADNEDVYRYLKGESLMIQGGEQGWAIVTVDGFPLGWGKLVNGQLKNHYPKGLRWG
ncbi:RsmF rRNA methyltransferase first C-terminal domain-containing protein [Thermincola potens]|uniref:RNA methylase, NOL1/NOP2/sun family n=1 Tax=Thermincola potens (strain JR) TaxID=635013 RepID=D5X945_THEPJ|nr:RsmF rRNA methyltransferase first C-terminal domain-containing protein [Thermincola potens]ADG81045.1 RNA methylase, NOL1/NOP2/sun family [Thermincola potens JR]